MSTFSESIPLRFMGSPAGHVQINNGAVEGIIFSTEGVANRIREYLDLCNCLYITLIERINIEFDGIVALPCFEITRFVQPVPAQPAQIILTRNWCGFCKVIRLFHEQGDCTVCGNNRNDAPMDLMPKVNWLQDRLEAINNHIIGRIKDNKPLPRHWLKERNELLDAIAACEVREGPNGQLHR